MNFLVLMVLTGLNFAHAKLNAQMPALVPNEKDRPLVILGEPKKTADKYLGRLADTIGRPYARLDLTHFDSKRTVKIWGPLSRNLSARPGPLVLGIELPDPAENPEAYRFFVSEFSHRQAFTYEGRTYSLDQVTFALFAPNTERLAPEITTNNLVVWRPEDTCAENMSFVLKN